ncbi:hypothetical protein BDV40DRAFT_291148 [Aspergillus tamarii]|uniref:FAD/NAD(P)-binding domain-containing protein n=1 Tax=Aspergillus tamarii TaxID=41984 RepID=A0A5N6UKR3_ASPTM|nr:hypothetical protein BDV40DRAFT_291148 [Aspergillus tamarii]
MTIMIDLVVVGAGWFGLSAAKHYIQLHPNERTVVLESANSCNGTWGADRLYPDLKSNNMVGSYEYPDFPMLEEVYGVRPDTHIPAATMCRYLTDYAHHFGVFERVQFNTTVNTVELGPDDGWTLTIDPGSGPSTLHTKRLVLATGLTSLPNMPSFTGQESFNGPVFHARDFHKRADTLTTCKRVVVVGGAKSAFDVSYAYVQAGVQVDLVIRPDGNGPRKMEELLHTRCITWFSPSPWQDEDGYSVVRSFLHGTKLGNLIVNTFWSILSADIVEANGYEDHHHPTLGSLKPWHSAFWTGSGVSIHNFDSSIFDLVKQGNIRVHSANITQLTEQQVHLSTGETLDADAIDAALVKDTVEMDGLLKTADDEILSRFPILKSQPSLRSRPKTKSNPLRCMISSVSTSTCPSLQGLWISAYFDDALQRVPQTQQEAIHEVVTNSVWGKWRYPCGYGEDVADFASDALPYFDLIMKDLGLNNHRKPTTISEIAEPYKPWDYKEIVDEWLQKRPITNAK